MSDNVNLTIKIDPALKEQIKQLALDKQVSMSQEIVERLTASFKEQAQPEIDNQNTEEAAESPFSAAEIKQLRALLKKQSKKKK